MIEHNDLLMYIGKKIKLYRKLKQMNVEKLAELIHKSRATVAKYEEGKIAIDIIVLTDIAEALDVELKYLFDYKRRKTDNPVSGHDQIYNAECFYIYKINDKKIQNSVMHILISDDLKERDVALYYNMRDGENIETATCVYHGVMKNYKNMLNFTLHNYYNHAEIAMLNVEVPMRRTDYLVGMMQGISSDTLRPINFKVIVTQEPWNKSAEELKQKFVLSKEVIREMKDKNIIMVD